MEAVLIASNLSWPMRVQGVNIGWLVGPLLVGSFGIKDLAFDKHQVFEK
jgi:hypothetical protein